MKGKLQPGSTKCYRELKQAMQELDKNTNLFLFPSKADGKTRADFKCSVHVEKDNCSFFVLASARSKKNPGVFRASKNTCVQTQLQSASWPVSVHRHQKHGK